MNKKMRPATEAAFMNVLDTFACTDGGQSLVMFKAFVKDFDSRAAAGDGEAEQVLGVLHRMSRLIDVAVRPPEEV